MMEDNHKNTHGKVKIMKNDKQKRVHKARGIFFRRVLKAKDFAGAIEDSS
jgi:hypothetical protein